MWLWLTGSCLSVQCGCSVLVVADVQHWHGGLVLGWVLRHDGGDPVEVVLQVIDAIQLIVMACVDWLAVV
jgi:hypothetical protein